jgi:hypothetical protein
MLQPGAERLEPTACFDLMLAGFDRARKAGGPPSEHCYRFGAHTVRFLFASEPLVDALTPALAHLRVADDGPADLTVHLWDTRTTGEPLSPFVELLTDRIGSDPYRWLTPRHEIIGISNARVPATLDQWSGAFSVYDRETARAVYWIDDASAVAYFERGAPLRTLLSWWLSDVGYQSVHAAGVGDAEGGVLLAGKGGSGKSSTALRCLDEGMRYLADDYCMFSVDPPATAFSMYNTAKLNGVADLQRQPRFLPFVENPEAAGAEKLLMFLERHFPEQMALSLPIRAVVVPHATDDPASTMSPISPGVALAALGPTTLLQRPGSAQSALRAMGELVRRVPCYGLRLGSDGADAPGLIAGLLDP